MIKGRPTRRKPSKRYGRGTRIEVARGGGPGASTSTGRRNSVLRVRHTGRLTRLPKTCLPSAPTADPSRRPSPSQELERSGGAHADTQFRCQMWQPWRPAVCPHRSKGIFKLRALRGRRLPRGPASHQLKSMPRSSLVPCHSKRLTASPRSSVGRVRTRSREHALHLYPQPYQSLLGRQRQRGLKQATHPAASRGHPRSRARSALLRSLDLRSWLTSCGWLVDIGGRVVPPAISLRLGHPSPHNAIPAPNRADLRPCSPASPARQHGHHMPSHVEEHSSAASQ